MGLQCLTVPKLRPRRNQFWCIFLLLQAILNLTLACTHSSTHPPTLCLKVVGPSSVILAWKSGPSKPTKLRNVIYGDSLSNRKTIILAGPWWSSSLERHISYLLLVHAQARGFKSGSCCSFFEKIGNSGIRNDLVYWQEVRGSNLHAKISNIVVMTSS